MKGMANTGERDDLCRRAIRPLLSLCASTFVISALINPIHLVDAFIGEESPLRLWMLKNYARVEVRFIRLLFWILRRPFLSHRWARKFMYYAGAKFIGERAIVGQVMTLGEMEEFIRKLPEGSAIAVGPCRCRLATHGCAHPMETDIYILTGAPIWLEVFPQDYRTIDKEEAIKIVRESNQAGLVQMVDRHMYFRENANYFVICNCCSCSCIVINGYRTFKYDGYHLIPSTYRVELNSERCQGCGSCVEACNFGERVVRAGKARVLDCQGCGLCVRVCPNQANYMVKR